MESWLGRHWFDALQTAGILVAMSTAVFSIRDQNRTRRVENLFRITREHRDIWTELFRKPELKRVVDPQADLVRQPLSPEEEMFALFIILHLGSVFAAKKHGQIQNLSGLADDIRGFFKLPIPMVVWSRAQRFQAKDFVEFVEAFRGQ